MDRERAMVPGACWWAGLCCETTGGASVRALCVAAAAASILAGTEAARADNMFEVERARAVARAGGPIDSYDAELLERWGVLSGTPEWRSRVDDGQNRSKPRTKSPARKDTPNRD